MDDQVKHGSTDPVEPVVEGDQNVPVVEAPADAVVTPDVDQADDAKEEEAKDVEAEKSE